MSGDRAVPAPTGSALREIPEPANPALDPQRAPSAVPPHRLHAGTCTPPRSVLFQTELARRAWLCACAAGRQRRRGSRSSAAPVVGGRQALTTVAAAARLSNALRGLVLRRRCCPVAAPSLAAAAWRLRWGRCSGPARGPRGRSGRVCSSCFLLSPPRASCSRHRVEGRLLPRLGSGCSGSRRSCGRARASGALADGGCSLGVCGGRQLPVGAGSVLRVCPSVRAGVRAWTPRRGACG